MQNDTNFSAMVKILVYERLLAMQAERLDFEQSGDLFKSMYEDLYKREIKLEYATIYKSIQKSSYNQYLFSEKATQRQRNSMYFAMFVVLTM